MNTKIARALSLLFQLPDEDRTFVFRLWNMNEAERELLIEALQPEKPATKKSSKSAPRKIQHCAVCDWTKRAALHKDTAHDDYHEFVTSLPEPKPSEQKPSKPATKSERASGMAAQLKSRVNEQREATTTTKDDNYAANIERCMFTDEDGPCGYPADANVHHLKTHPDYHEFVEGKSSAAPPAPVSSSANGASSATEKGTRKPAPPSTPGSDDGEERSALSSIVGSVDGTDDAGNVPAGLRGSEKTLV